MKSRSVYYLDIETDINNDQKFVCAAIYIPGKDEKNIFYSEKEFFSFFLEKIPDRTKIFAHAGGSFDFIWVINILLKIFPDFQIKNCVLVGSRILKASIKIKNKTIFLIDTIFKLPASLDSLADSFGFKKEKINYDKILEEKNVGEKCYNHAEVLYKVVKYFNEKIKNDLGIDISDKITSAGISHKILNKFFDLNKLEKCDTKITDKFREYYFGGRCEIFKISGHVKVYDVNSMYPFVMKNNKFPVSAPYVTKDKNIDEKSILIKAKIKTNRKIPCIPVKREDGSLVFPSGEFISWIWKPEFELLKNEEILEIYGQIRADKWEDIFSDFVEYGYKMRKVSKADKAIWKIILNSSYGKFAERKEKGLYNYTIYKNYILRTPKSFDQKYKYERVDIAGLITSLARAHLYKLIEAVGEEHVYYCDTDSIFIDTQLSEDFVGEELGKVKIEKEGEYEAIQPKVYKIEINGGRIIKAKGFPKDCFEDEDFWINLSRGINYSSVNKLKTMLNSGKFSSKKVKCIRKKYDKRIIVGNDTLPIILSGGK